MNCKQEVKNRAFADRSASERACSGLHSQTRCTGRYALSVDRLAQLQLALVGKAVVLIIADNQMVEHLYIDGATCGHKLLGYLQVFR